jgi:hypothetical protein
MLLCVSDSQQALCLRRIFNLCLAADKILFINFEKYDAYLMQEKSYVWQLTIFIHPNLQKHHVKQFVPKPDKVLVFPPLKGIKNTIDITSINQLELETNKTFNSRERGLLNANFFTNDTSLFETSVMESIMRIPGFMETFKVPSSYPKTVKKIKTSSECISCQEENVQLTVLNCGHECICTECVKSWDQTCPMCRKRIKLIIY